MSSPQPDPRRLLNPAAFTGGRFHLQLLELEEMPLAAGGVTGDTELRGTGGIGHGGEFPLKKEGKSVCHLNSEFFTL